MEDLYEDDQYHQFYAEDEYPHVLEEMPPIPDLYDNSYLEDMTPIEVELDRWVNSEDSWRILQTERSGYLIG